MNRDFDELRGRLADALAEHMGVPLAAVEDAVEYAMDGWAVTRKDYPHRDDHPLAEPRFGHTIVATLPFVPETDAEAAKREAWAAAQHWAAVSWIPGFDPAIAAAGGYTDEDDPGPPPERIGANQLLGQGLWWRARDESGSGTVAVRLEDMTHDHRMGLLGFLRRNAAKYKMREDWHFAATPGPNGDMAQLAFEQECDRQWATPADQWIEDQPLVRALVYWTTPVAESPLTYQGMETAPHDGTVIMVRWVGAPEYGEIRAAWSRRYEDWLTVDGDGNVDPYVGGFDDREEPIEWRPLRDDEAPPFEPESEDDPDDH